MFNTTTSNPADRRWLAMALPCLGELMIALDTTIVNVALPSIRAGLHFTEITLAWVVNAYMLTFGGCLLLGLGSGMALNPVLLAAMNDIAADQSGLASGIVNTAFMMGGALGLAILASVASARTDSLRAGGLDPLTALTGGYQLAFLTSALMTALTIVLALLLRPPREA